MALTLIYKRKGKREEQEVSGTDDLGAFIYNNQPLEVIAVRIEKRDVARDHRD